MRSFLRCLFLSLPTALCGCAHAVGGGHGPIVLDTVEAPAYAADISSPAVAPTALRAESFLGPAAEKMDEQARTDFLKAQQSVLEHGGMVTWQNASIGAHGTTTVKPESPTGEAYPSLTCKGFASTVWVLGNGRMVTGDACRQMDGTWLAMSREDAG